MRRFQFTDDEYNKLSLITGTPVFELKKLDAMGLLTNEIAVKLVFEYEYKMQRDNKVLPKLIFKAIAMKYGIPIDKVRRYIFTKPPVAKYCSVCHKEIGAAEYKRNEGRCEQCVIDSITL